MFDIYLLLGSNLGDRQACLALASDLIEIEIAEIQRKSAVYATAPWGKNDQPEFLNQVIFIRSSMQPQSVLEKIKLIENEIGRERVEKWGARCIDIDILLQSNLTVNEPDLIIPHPRMHERRFALTPLNELIPNFRHPVLDKTIYELYSQLQDNLAVSKMN
jgi:2-amino-4-hydroxy-6-hydroxymethyldihydropteridine diphosphokinase